MNKTYIGIDNGTTGSIGIIQDSEVLFFKTPVILQQNYKKEKGNISRIVVSKFVDIIRQIEDIENDFKNSIAILERPMVNPGRFNNSLSAVRCLEAQLVILEYYNIPYLYCDSKEWQSVLLPKWTGPSVKKDMPKKEKEKIKQDRARFLKTTSIDIGCRLFPHLKELIVKQKDADSLLIAEWARRKNL